MAWEALAIAVAGAGLDYFKGKSASDLKRKQQKRAHAAQVAQQYAARNFQNLQIRKGNEYRQRIWEEKVNVYNQQVQFNEEAAARAYEGAQINRNRQLQAFAFQLSDRQAELLEAVGANAASMEGDNRSAQLAAAKMTFGRYGRQRAQSFQQVMDLNADTRRYLDGIHRQHITANFAAKSRLGVPPMMQAEIPPQNYAEPVFEQFNPWLGGASAAFTGMNLFNTFKPQSAGNIGSGGSGGGYGVNSSNYSSQAANYGGGFNMTNTGVDMSGSFSGNFSGNQLGLVNVNVKDAFKIGG